MTHIVDGITLIDWLKGWYALAVVLSVIKVAFFTRRYFTAALRTQLPFLWWATAQGTILICESAFYAWVIWWNPESPDLRTWAAGLLPVGIVIQCIIGISIGSRIIRDTTPSPLHGAELYLSMEQPAWRDAAFLTLRQLLAQARSGDTIKVVIE